MQTFLTLQTDQNAEAPLLATSADCTNMLQVRLFEQLLGWGFSRAGFPAIRAGLKQKWRTCVEVEMQERCENMSTAAKPLPSNGCRMRKALRTSNWSTKSCTCMPAACCFQTRSDSNPSCEQTFLPPQIYQTRN